MELGDILNLRGEDRHSTALLGWVKYMQLFDDILSTFYMAKLHWAVVRQRNARNFCKDCKYQWTEDCPFYFIKKNTYSDIKVCQNFEK